MNVRMRLLTEEDLAMVMEWRMRPYITRFMNTDPKLTMEGQRKWFEKVSSDPAQINWIIEYDDVPVGFMNVVDIDRVNGRCSWGYYIAEREKRSLKLAVYLEWNLYNYVFDVLGLHKLCNETFTENKQVVKLHQLCGSRQDGIMREHVYKNGRYFDVSAGSILRQEWMGKRGDLLFEIFPFEDRYPGMKSGGV